MNESYPPVGLTGKFIQYVCIKNKNGKTGSLLFNAWYRPALSVNRRSRLNQKIFTLCNGKMSLTKDCQGELVEPVLLNPPSTSPG